MSSLSLCASLFPFSLPVTELRPLHPSAEVSPSIALSLLPICALQPCAKFTHLHVHVSSTPSPFLSLSCPSSLSLCSFISSCLLPSHRLPYGLSPLSFLPLSSLLTTESSHTYLVSMVHVLCVQVIFGLSSPLLSAHTDATIEPHRLVAVCIV